MSILVYLMGKVFVLSLLAGVLYLFTFVTVCLPLERTKELKRVKRKLPLSGAGLFYFFVAMQLLSSWLSEL
ncbi:hypothetical protein IGI80_003661 [Enterococcus sp. DIV1420a]